MILPISGKVIRRSGNKLQSAQPGLALVSPPDDPVDILWGSHCTGVSIWVEKKPFEMLLASYAGIADEADVLYEPVIDLTRGAGLGIAQSLRDIVASTSDNKSSLNLRMRTQPHEEMLLMAAMHGAVCLRRKFSDRIRQKTSHKRLCRALDFIHEHLHEEIRANEICAAAGVSVRTLQYQFSRHFGIGPMSYTRREKLRRIQQELRRRKDTTVANIAAGWGFYDPKYFSKLYLQEFGERPSITKKRFD